MALPGKKKRSGWVLVQDGDELEVALAGSVPDPVSDSEEDGFEEGEPPEEEYDAAAEMARHDTERDEKRKRTMLGKTQEHISLGKVAMSKQE